MKETIKLPSGAELIAYIAPFAEAKELYQAILAQGPAIKIEGKDEVENALKDTICLMLSSKSVEKALFECMQRSTYNGTKIKPDETFEDVKAREDYIMVCYEVARVNIMPFWKGLYASLGPLLQKMKEFQA